MHLFSDSKHHRSNWSVSLAFKFKPWNIWNLKIFAGTDFLCNYQLFGTDQFLHHGQFHDITPWSLALTAFYGSYGVQKPKSCFCLKNMICLLLRPAYKSWRMMKWSSSVCFAAIWATTTSIKISHIVWHVFSNTPLISRIERFPRTLHVLE